jgi:tRNA (cmo5U34)-methyltransferase
MNDSTNHYPKQGHGTWEFDKDVANVFDDMLDKSIPLYEQSRELIAWVAKDFLQSGGCVVDLGSSTGNSLKAIRKEISEIRKTGIRYVGVDNSQAMVDKAIENCHWGEFYCEDINYPQTISRWMAFNPSVVILSLTLQFVPIEHRQDLISRIYQIMPQRGVLFVYEKCLGENSRSEKFLTNLYYKLKEKNGYSTQAIAEKRKSLENVLVPLTLGFNKDMIAQEGFRVETLLTWCNFSLLAGIKE